MSTNGKGIYKKRGEKKRSCCSILYQMRSWQPVRKQFGAMSVSNEPIRKREKSINNAESGRAKTNIYSVTEHSCHSDSSFKNKVFWQATCHDKVIFINCHFVNILQVLGIDRWAFYGFNWLFGVVFISVEKILLCLCTVECVRFSLKCPEFFCQLDILLTAKLFPSHVFPPPPPSTFFPPSPYLLQLANWVNLFQFGTSASWQNILYNKKKWSIQENSPKTHLTAILPY